MDNSYHLCNTYTVLAISLFKTGKIAEARKYSLLAEELAESRSPCEPEADLPDKGGNRAKIRQLQNCC